MKKIILLFIFICLSIQNIFCSVYKTNVTASYYAEAFHGKKTSNGEKFNMNDLTCAHKSLPFDTILKITNLSNGKTVNVRVNDRGPFVLNREIDLSKAAAIQLNMIGQGTAKVDIEIVKLGPNTKLSTQTAASAQKMMASLESKSTQKNTAENLPAGTYWDIQVGSFSSQDNAYNFANKLYQAGFSNIVFQKYSTYTRVAIKNVPAQDVSKIEEQLDKKGFTQHIHTQRKKY